MSSSKEKISMDEKLDLISSRDKIGEELKLLEEKLKDRNLRNFWLNTEYMRIKFPHGYVRSVSSFEQRFPYIKNKSLRKNICYTLQFTDLVRWLINRFKIVLTLRGILLKVGIIALSSVVEGMCYGFIMWYRANINGNISIPKEFKSMVNFLEKTAKVIDRDFADELHWLRRTRNNIHLWNAGWEYNKYTLTEYNRAVWIVQILGEVFRDYWKKSSK